VGEGGGMIAAPIDRVLERLEAVGANPRQNGKGWNALCPAHADRNPSLSVTNTAEDTVLLNCHAGCSTDAVLKALGLEIAELFAASKPKSSSSDVVEVYNYPDEHGSVRFQVVRKTGKRFVQRQPDGKGGHVYNLTGVRGVPYRLPELIDAVHEGRLVVVTEGEKDADAVVRAGYAATCNPGGAGKWKNDYSPFFEGATVLLIADRDEPGRKHAAQVAASLVKVGAKVDVVQPATGKDVSDHLAAGLELEDLVPVDLTENFSPARSSEGLEDVSNEVSDEPGWQVLDDVAGFIGRFVAFPKAAYLTLVTLWVAHAHAWAAAESTPRLAVLSAEKQSGKTRLLEVLELIVANPLFAVNCSPAALYRAVAEAAQTLLLDEIDAVFGPKAKEHEDLRALINSGHRRGAEVWRVVGEGGAMKAKPFPVFCPVAVAGIGVLPDTLADRSVLVHMKRRAPGERVEPFRRRRVKPEADALRRRSASWAKRHLDALEAADPEMPATITDRPADVYEALFAIADEAGGTWPARAREAALEVEQERENDESSWGVNLLADIERVFDGTDAGDDERRRPAVDKLSSADLVDRLAAIEESPWGSLGKAHDKAIDARGLAYRLKPYGIRPHTIRLPLDHILKGYQRDDFTDAWRRYLPTPEISRHTVTNADDVTETSPLTSTVTAVTAVTDYPEGYGTSRNGDRHNDPAELFVDVSDYDAEVEL
jgi:hypothetical protein